MLSAIKNRYRKWTRSWLFRLGGPEPGEVFLKQRRVYILPTQAGLMLFVMLVVLFIGSVNYTLGLGFVLTFTLASCGVVDMHMTFRNLAHLVLKPGHANTVFAGEEAQFELHLINRYKYGRYAVWLGFFEENPPRIEQVADVGANSTCTVSLHLPTTERGWLQAPRIRLQTRFPLGLLRSWAYWMPDMRALVYPFPEEQAPPLPMEGSESKEGNGQIGSDDFAGVRAYQAGDAMKHLAWRQIARVDLNDGGNLVTKHFEGGTKGDLCLDFSRLPYGLGVEGRLSRMARWVLDAEQQAIPYAFKLGAIDFAPAIGPAHQAACLRALALYEGT